MLHNSSDVNKARLNLEWCKCACKVVF